MPWFARLTTGAKSFLILSVALLPLALIVVFAVLQTTQLAEESARARLRVAAAESGRRLAIELQGDANALRSALGALVTDPADMPSCARVTGVFAPQFVAGTRFAIIDSAGRLACGSPVDARGIRLRDGEMKVAIVPGQGLLMTLGGPGRAGARVFFPTTFLERISRPGAELDDLQIRLLAGEATLDLQLLPAPSALERRQQVSTATGVDDLTLQMTVPSNPITSSVVVAMLLPLLMWAAAAGITWLAVDRLFIRPIRQLNASIAAYRPGEVIGSPAGAGAHAVEIRELYDSFVRLSRTVVDHEAELAEGLVRQTKLTREVHHRVKNNLQVIASLINFHARGATVPEAVAAYASIQRRVDALAVVHRNHFAEMEVNRGLGLRPMISELSANIRATAPEAASGLGITLEIAPFLVSQDTAVAVSFLITELIELAMSCQPAAQIRISARADAVPSRALLRVISPALIPSEALEALLTHRYGRVIEGLSRQLRSKLHHDPLTGAYEISVAVLGIE
jgi:two-component sensor histidine kinase